MIIRTATPGDKPAIIELLKKSLGESLIPKSTELWNWKHEQNPFGPSFVLLAEEENELIGVRAFMQWKWQWNNKVYNAIRAVDTATHPGHQGKGIFKKLTLKQLEICKQQGIDFVFNTPNEQSRPGYIKMGWQQQGKLPLKIKLLCPLPMTFRIALKKKVAPSTFTAASHAAWKQVLNNLLDKQPLAINGIHTVTSNEYLTWRYTQNPLFPYQFISDNKNYLLIYRIKSHRSYQELRITDFILYNEDQAIVQHIKQEMKKVCKVLKTDMISISGNPYLQFRPYFKWMGILPVKPLGPIVTLRKVNPDLDFVSLMDSHNWKYSLGDLELF